MLYIRKCYSLLNKKDRNEHLCCHLDLAVCPCQVSQPGGAASFSAQSAAGTRRGSLLPVYFFFNRIDIRLSRSCYILGLLNRLPQPLWQLLIHFLRTWRAGCRSSAAGEGEMMAGLLLALVGGLLEVCSGVSANRGGYPSFTDEIPFKITWPGAEFTLVCLLF